MKFFKIVLLLGILSCAYGASLFDNFSVQNSSIWNFDPYTSLDNGRIKIQLPSGTTWSGAHSAGKVYLYGDFDMQVDYNAASLPATNGWHVLMRAQTDDQKIVEIKRAYYGSNIYDAAYYNGSAWQTWNPIATSDTSGKLRITRTGSNFYVSYWDSVDNRWEYNNNPGGYLVASGIGTAPVFFFLATGTQSNNFVATSYFDNFTVSATNIVPEIHCSILLVIGMLSLYVGRRRLSAFK